MVTQLYLGIVALVFCLAGDVYVRFSKEPTDARSPQGPTGTRSTPAPADQRRPAGRPASPRAPDHAPIAASHSAAVANSRPLNVTNRPGAPTWDQPRLRAASARVRRLPGTT